MSGYMSEVYVQLRLNLKKNSIARVLV